MVGLTENSLVSKCTKNCPYGCENTPKLHHKHAVSVFKRCSISLWVNVFMSTGMVAASGCQKLSRRNASGAFWLRGIWTVVWMRRGIQEVTAHIQGERQQPAVQVHHHVLLRDPVERTIIKGVFAVSAGNVYRLAALTDLVLLQGEELVTRRATADQLPSTVKGGET